MSRERMFAVMVLSAFGAAAMACSGGGGGSNSNDTASHSSKHGSNDTNNDDPGTSAEPGDTSMPSSTNPPPPPATDAGTDSGTKAPPPGGPTCKAIASCTSTQALAAIAGDSNSEATGAGAGSQWFTIRVQEQSTSSAPISVDAILMPPEGADYELHVYADDCKTELATPVANDDGSIEVYSSWDDRNFLDDGKNLTIEVRYKSGGCDNSNKWNLDVYGGL